MKKKLIAAIEKFSLAQMTSNSNGKTSGSGSMGVLICTIGAVCFLLGCIDKMWITHSIDIVTQSIIFVGIGAALLGYRKSKDTSGDIEITKVKTDTHPNILCECPDGCACGNCDFCK